MLQQRFILDSLYGNQHEEEKELKRKITLTNFPVLCLTRFSCVVFFSLSYSNKKQDAIYFVPLAIDKLVRVIRFPNELYLYFAIHVNCYLVSG